jgi:RNA polymerase sigma-70 factor (ECF subfamily)
MSKRVSKAASLELTFLAALENVHADVDISEIAEIQDWSRAVRGKLYGAMVKDASNVSKQKTDLPPALKPPIATTPLGSSSKGVSGVVLGASSNVASHGSVQYSQMEIPRLLAVCTSEPSTEAWLEFVGRVHPFIATAITKAVVRRFGNTSRELVDDLSQEVYLRLCSDNFRALRSFEFHHENSIYGFLKVLAANVANDHFRRAASFRAGAAQEQIPIEANRALREIDMQKASSVIERGVLLEEIDRRLKTLSHEPNFARDRAIFWLYYRQGLPAKEIAALPDIKLSVKGVESVLLRLTRQLKVALR